MTEAVTVELVGGPAHGKQYAWPESKVGEPIRVMVAPRCSYDELVENEPEGFVEPETVTYVFLRRDPATRIHIYVRESDRPRPPRLSPKGSWQFCRECDVKWWGEATCWFCEKDVTTHTRTWNRRAL